MKYTGCAKLLYDLLIQFKQAELDEINSDGFDMPSKFKDEELARQRCLTSPYHSRLKVIRKGDEEDANNTKSERATDQGDTEPSS